MVPSFKLRVNPSKSPTWVGSQQHFSGCAMNPLAAMPPLTMLDGAEAVAWLFPTPAPSSR